MIKASKKAFKKHITGKKFAGKKSVVVVKAGQHIAVPAAIAHVLHELALMIFDYELPMDVCLYIGIFINGSWAGFKNFVKQRKPKG